MEAETEANHGVSFADALRVWGDDRPTAFLVRYRSVNGSNWVESGHSGANNDWPHLMLCGQARTPRLSPAPGLRRGFLHGIERLGGTLLVNQLDQALVGSSGHAIVALARRIGEGAAHVPGAVVAARQS